jgi:ZIP family zinc transporter
VALAITIYNIPEGLAVGVSTAYHVELGFVTALAIAIQDVPEGVAVVMPSLRYKIVKTAVAVGVLSALVEGGGYRQLRRRGG